MKYVYELAIIDAIVIVVALEQWALVPSLTAAPAPGLKAHELASLPNELKNT